MPTSSNVLRQTVPVESAYDNATLTLGLPLETASGAIYPVFQASRSNITTDRTIRQIGYLEIGDNRSDFVSLEPRSRAPLIITLLVILSFLLGGIVRRLRH